MDFVVDTDVLIDFLRGREHARAFLTSMAEEGALCCSAITVAELYAGMRSTEKPKTDELIDSLTILEVDKEIAQKAGGYKAGTKSHTLELADCIIAATAFCYKAVLATGNTKHYPMDDIEKRAMLK
jgi:predicted nucleic acid-binding protein